MSKETNLMDLTEIQQALKEYGCKEAFPDARLREYIAVMSGQEKKTTAFCNQKIAGQLREMSRKLEGVLNE